MSPSEPLGRRALLSAAIGAIESSECEARGADVLVFTPSGSIGIQIKTVPRDFTLSVQDGRLAKELPLLRERTAIPFLLLEGPFLYDNDGLLRDPAYSKPLRFTRDQVRKLLLSVKYTRSVDVICTDGLEDTVSVIRELKEYFSKGNHKSFLARSPLISAWGVASRRERQLHILQGFSGTGVGLAEKILNHFGRVPLKFDCTLEEMLQVPLIGPARVRKLWEDLK